MSDQGLDDELDPKYDQKRSNSLESNMLTPKQYFLVNISKFIVEMVGTMMIGIFYILMGNEQTGILLGFWVVTLFAESISGAHFNPGITLVFMLRQNSNLGQRRLKGIIYIVGQLCGGIIAGLIGLMINPGLTIHPRPVLSPVDEWVSDTQPKWTFGTLNAYISEIVGSFVFIFLFMLATEKNSQFSEDKVINCFILASAYVAARLIAGGQMVTCFAHMNIQNKNLADKVESDTANSPQSQEMISIAKRLLQTATESNNNLADQSEAISGDQTATAPPTTTTDDTFITSWQQQLRTTKKVIEAGPLLNPAIGFGLLLTELNFRLSVLQYLLCPFVGSILALVFYEHIYVKTQELLNDDVSSAGANDSGLGQLNGEIEPNQQNDEQKDTDTPAD